MLPLTVTDVRNITWQLQFTNSLHVFGLFLAMENEGSAVVDM
jgi:hypothetical protein